MICPHCSVRNELGAETCASCGHPFTRRAARRSGRSPDANARRFSMRPETFPPQRGVPEEEYARYYGPPPARPRRAPRPRPQGNRAIGGLIAFLIVTIVVIGVATVLATGNTSQSISDGVTGTISSLIDGTSDSDRELEIPPAPEEPAGDTTWVLTEQELNERIANRGTSFGPANDVTIELGEGTVTVRFHAYGVHGTYHGTLTAQDGVPVVADSRIDGALGWFVGSGDIDSVLNEEMAAAVQERDVAVESVHVEPGQLIFGIRSA
jgi:hypothetical protein